MDDRRKNYHLWDIAAEARPRIIRLTSAMRAHLREICGTGRQ